MHQLDLSLFQAVNAWCGNWTLDRIVLFEETHNFYKGGLFMIAYWWFWFDPRTEQRDTNRSIIVAAIAGSVLALVVNRAMATGLPFRVRPMLAPASGYRPPSLPIIGNMEEWSSFPSDTATFFFALALGLLRLCRTLGIAAFIYSVVWISLPRLYLGLHYPSDIVAGALLGMGTVWLCLAAVNARGGALGRRVLHAIDRAEQSHPQVFHVIMLVIAFEMMTLFDDLRDLTRSTVRLLRYTGHLAIGESAALFILGAAVLVAGSVVWLVRQVLHRRPPTRPKPM